LATETSPESSTAILRRHVRGHLLHPVNQVHLDEATLGERLADKVAGAIGTWTFLIVQGLFIVAWIVTNAIWLANKSWDPFPFILLNLLFSVQAAYTGPVLLLAGNRSAQHDRLRLEHTAEMEEAAEKVTLEILKEIERNTEATLKILEHIKQQRASPRPPA